MTTKPTTITCPDCGAHIEVDVKLAAEVLARQGRGKPKNVSQYELEWMRKRLAVVRMKCWPEPELMSLAEREEGQGR